MANATFTAVLSWVIANGYIMVFAAIIAGGPIFVSAAAFAAVLGYFNIYVIFSLAFFGEMAVDILLFLFGDFSRTRLVEKFGHYFGLTRERILGIEKLLVKHTWKTLLIIKYSPVIPMPGFVIAGAAKLPFKRFLYILLVLSLPKAVFFTLIGYYFGLAYDVFAKYFSYGEYFIIAIIIIFIAADYWFSRWAKKISKEEMKF